MGGLGKSPGIHRKRLEQRHPLSWSCLNSWEISSRAKFQSDRPELWLLCVSPSVTVSVTTGAVAAVAVLF